MPIYEYACKNCGQQFELLVRSDEKPSCPSCGKRRLTKQFSVSAAHTGGSEPACPARDAGACGVAKCPGGSCNMADFR